MCLDCCALFTWQVICYVMALCLMFVSFLFGPAYLIFLFTGKTDFTQKFIDESAYTIFLTCIILLMWLVFVVSCILLNAIPKKRVYMIDVFIRVMVVHMALALMICSIFGMYCTFVDYQCFDHTPGREGNDIYTGIGLFFVGLAYVGIFLVVTFAACNLKWAIYGEDDYIEYVY